MPHQRVHPVSIGEPGVDPILLSAMVSGSHVDGADVSSHPTEVGEVVDNYRRRPKAIDIDGIVIDTPISTDAPGVTLYQSAMALVQGDLAPSESARAEFERFFDQRVRLTIITPFRTYLNMFITSLNAREDVGTADGMFFSLSAREVLFAVVQTGLAIPMLPSGQKTKPEGKKTNKNPTPAQESKSLTAKALDFLF